MTQKRKSLPYPFNYAKTWFGVDFSDVDLEYINNVICCDKMYRMIKQADDRWEFTIGTKHPEDTKYDGFVVVSSEQANQMLFVQACNLINFLEKFTDDSNCPDGVKYFIWKYVGQRMEEMKEGGYEDYQSYSALAELWMRKTRGGGKNKCNQRVI